MTELDPSVLLGSQYYVNTEDTPEQIRAGIHAMGQAGLKLVRIFLQWTHVEPRQGRWYWDQYDALFDTAAEEGIGVIITLTAIHPAGWMKISYGPQDIGPLEDEAYWEKAAIYVRQVSARYSQHPAMHSWILNNEPSLHLEHDEAVLKRFQGFVSRKYNGDIEQLNRCSFQQLDSFDELTFSAGEGGFSAYTGRLNWLEFAAFRLLEVLARIKELIRETGDTHPVHVNPHGLVSANFLPEGQSIWGEGRLVDFMGCSAHPSWHSTRFLPGRLHQSVAFYADLMRGATRAPNKYFWVTELQGGTNIYSGLTYLGPSGEELRSWMWESIAAGAKGIVYWCFNYRVSGYEAGEWSLVDQQGRPSPRLKEVSELAAFLKKHDGLFRASVPARAPVALLYSEANWRLGSVEGQGQDPEYPRNALMAADALTGAWAAFTDAGISVDVIDEIDLQNGAAANYAVLVVPGCTALEDDSLPVLQSYVEGGGTLLADGLCGYKKPDGWLRDVAANPLNELFGVSVADIQAVPEAQNAETTGDLRLPVWFLKVALEPLVEVRIPARFVESEPRPALSIARKGRGQAIRLGTVFFQHYFQNPVPEAFGQLLSLLSLGREAVNLVNASSYLRLRRLDLPDGQLLVLVNSGEATTAHLNLEPGVSLTRLSADGEESLGQAGGSLQVKMEAQSGEVFHLKS